MMKKTVTLITLIDDKIVARVGLGWSWVIYSCMMTVIAIVLYAMTRWATSSAFILVIMASAYAAMAVICAIFAYAVGKLGRWDDRRNLEERKKDHE